QSQSFRYDPIQIMNIFGVIKLMITMNDIVREGNPSLREVANEVEVPPTEADKQLLNEMLTFLKNSQDEKKAEEYNLRPVVGLAAPQLAIHKRLVAIHFEDANGKL